MTLSYRFEHRKMHISKKIPIIGMVVKSYPVVGFISLLFYCLLSLFKMGKCEQLFVQNLQLVVAHHSQAFN